MHQKMLLPSDPLTHKFNTEFPNLIVRPIQAAACAALHAYSISHFVAVATWLPFVAGMEYYVNLF